MINTVLLCVNSGYPKVATYIIAIVKSLYHNEKVIWPQLI